MFKIEEYKMIKNLLRAILIIFSYIINKNKKSTVIYYHDVDFKYTDMGNSRNCIIEHLKVLKSLNYEFVSEIIKPEGQIMVCFDDGWKGIYDNQDIFINESVFPTIFIAVDLIGTDGYLTENQIKELVSKGFNLGVHTWSHVDLTELSDEELEHQLIDSKKKLQEMFSMDFDTICFPMGRFSRKVYLKCIDAGYRLMYASFEGSFYDYYDKKLICRNYLQFISPRLLKFYVKGHSRLLFRRAVKQQYVE